MNNKQSRPRGWFRLKERADLRHSADSREMLGQRPPKVVCPVGATTGGSTTWEQSTLPLWTCSIKEAYL